jgi:hypothetical protein
MAKRKTFINTGSKVVDALYTAVKNYVEESGGKILVLGGIEVQVWPEDKKGQFRVAIKCLGKKPEL